MASTTDVCIVHAPAVVCCFCRLACELACETVATKVSVVVRAQKPNVVEVFVEDFCCDILCEYVCNVVQGTDLVHCKDTIVYQLLYEQVLQINVLCFL